MFPGSQPPPRLDALRRRADAFAAPLGEVCGIVQQAAAAEQQRMAAAGAKLRQQVQGLLRNGMTIMTCSLSSTVLAQVKEAAGENRSWAARSTLCFGALRTLPGRLPDASLLPSPCQPPA